MARGDRVPRRRIHVFLGGQHENVGDVVLRRHLVDALSGSGEIHAFVGSAPADFVEGLQLPDSARVYRSFFRWLAAASLGAAVPRRAAFVLNAGEISCTPHDGSWHLALIPALAVGRLTGNPAVRVGVGARNRTGIWQLPLAVAGRLCRMVVWRDEVSRDLYGYGGVGPDWAFREAWDGEVTERRSVAVTWRGDRPRPSDALVRSLGSWIRSRGYEPVVVTQVQRDEAANEALAGLLGCAHVGASTHDLAERERQARETYLGCEMVISDRIHALIVAGSCGAAPVGLLAYDDVKIARTMRAAGLDLDVRGCPPGAVTSDLDGWLDARLAERSATIEQLRHAARAVDEYERRLQDLLRS